MDNITYLANSKPYYATCGAVMARRSGSFTSIVSTGHEPDHAWRIADGLNNLTLAACFAAAGFRRSISIRKA